MDREALDRLTAVRIQTVGKSPFYGLLGMQLQIKEDLQCKSMWVDGKTLGYNPAFVKKESWDILQGTFAKLCHHIVLFHHLRRDGRDQTAWQQACDRVVYPAICDAGFAIPSSVVINASDAEKAAEEIYMAPPPKNDDDQEQDGDDDSKGGDNSQIGTPGEVRDQKNGDGSELSEAERETAEREGLKEIAALAQQAKAVGNLPAAIERQVKALLYPELDWREQLHEFCRAAAKTDYSWMRPNRRFIHSGLYLPSLSNEGRLDNLVLAIDVSGSIDQIALSMFAGSVARIQEEMKPEKTTVIFCNFEITEIREFGQDEDIDLSCRGGGGTNLIPPFIWVEESGIVPDVFLYFTDLYGRKPDSDPGYPVLWARPTDKVNGDKYLNMFLPAFGRLIQID